MGTVLNSYVCGNWVAPAADLVEIASAIDGSIIAKTGSGGIDFAKAARYARETGGKNLRALNFHQRADLLKKLATYLSEKKEPLYALAAHTGATKRDNMVDIEGGIGTLFAYASRGRRDLPGEKFIVEGPTEALSKGGKFAGAHILTPRAGIAVHINAFNFPVWGPLEKFAPAFLAGIPVITKPATATAYVSEALMRLIVESGILPEGALQMICGPTGNLLDQLNGQDSLCFTGSIETSDKLRNHPAVSKNAVRFVAERDSLNAAILGTDAVAGTPEFDLFIKEVVREMTVKAGQKCTAIRRVFVPRAQESAVVDALKTRLSSVKIGDPRSDDTQMGALVSLSQKRAVQENIAAIATEAEIVFGDPAASGTDAPDLKNGAFISPVLLRCAKPMEAKRAHITEAFGPVATVMAYDSLDEAVELVAKGEGSLVASLFTYDPVVASALVFGIAPYHGRLLVIDRDSGKESTGHGSPLPNLVHGGPGRAGGGEELGGMRAVHHYLQRTAIQASPDRIVSLTQDWSKGAATVPSSDHPFRKNFDVLVIGDTIETATRKVTLDDIEHFANFTGDTFYAHMDEAAAKANPFFPGRVAHGYLILSFAAGLFVEPAPGPVLANYGLDNLRFLKPVSPGDDIRVRLTVKQKQAARKPEYGEVRWDVEVFNQDSDTVARYELLTMNARAQQ
ncbi:MAG TPA: phenylacetic acid degradation bifunctional protein PaaZ [Xanthobacteraceae bacterium]|nr:phenylacetic acid degradation bifunctional protein PaaZ [Xanthobacteraceae bacterium]